MPDIDTILFYLAVITMGAYLAIAVEFYFGNRSIQALRDVEPPTSQNNTQEQQISRVSVIIPARNEERNIEEALTSVLHLDYPDYEILVLNDRSEDRTGEILDRMAQQYPQLRVVHIHELPEGWLGKNHALYTGAHQATGELLLFTDADIVMESSVLKRAVYAIQRQQLDHLPILPELKMPGFWLNWFSCGFSIFFSVYSRPWLVKFAKTPFHIGIGAFNLIRRDCYEAIGTHQAIAMRPDDDMKLGKLVKKHGYRQNVMYGVPLISVEWYHSMPALVDGLMKNAFAGLNYNLPLTILGILSQLILHVWPVIAIFTTTGPTQLLNLLVWVGMIFLCLDNGQINRIPARYSFLCGVGFPLVSALMMFIVAKSTFLTLKNNGISWRGTHYSLKELKANQV